MFLTAGPDFASLDPRQIGGAPMHYLYGSKKDVSRRLVATFNSEQQLRSYARWATLQETGPRAGKFEQGSALAGYNSWEESTQPLTDEDETAVVHNPSPSML
jgi:hypothetical protein